MKPILAFLHPPPCSANNVEPESNATDGNGDAGKEQRVEGHEQLLGASTDHTMELALATGARDWRFI